MSIFQINWLNRRISVCQSENLEFYQENVENVLFTEWWTNPVHPTRK